MSMKKKQQQQPRFRPATHVAVLTLADIKAATEAFDRGDTNAHDALEAVAAALEAYLATLAPRRQAA